MNKNKNDKKTGGSMNRRDFLRYTAGAAAVLASSPMTRTARAEVTYPTNILMISTDQQHFDTIAHGGCAYVKTPALDKLMKEGTSFNLSYTASPVCTPARGSWYTGLMPSEHGAYVNGEGMIASVKNMGEWFQQETNWDTYYIGKWHITQYSTLSIDGFTVLNGMISGHGDVWDTAVAKAVEGFLWNRTSQTPFLMCVNFLQPHDICEWLRLNENDHSTLRFPEISGELPSLPSNFNYDANEAQENINRRDGREPETGNWDDDQWKYYKWSYYRLIEVIDAEIGRILQALEDSGYADDTLIVFTSDHGEGLGEHQMVRKSMLYDSASHVPLIFWWPGHISADTVDSTNIVSGIDIMPTLCEYANINPPTGTTGTSLRPLLDGTPPGSWRDYLVVESPGNDGRLVRSSRYKYMTFYQDNVEQLFDMQTDSGETTNLANNGAYETVLKDHRGYLLEWESNLNTASKSAKQDAWWYQDLPWSNGFETGSYSDDGWTTQNADAVLATGSSAYIGTYGAKLKKTTWIEKRISTVGYDNIHVKYYRETVGLDSGENLYVEWSTDGTTWNNLETVRTCVYEDGQQDKTCSSGADDTPHFRIRFRTNASKTSEYGRVDGVQVTGTAV